ncbi:hypothetical protein GCM10027563_45900 [Parasphingorhabdus pacifica]
MRPHGSVSTLSFLGTALRSDLIGPCWRVTRVTGNPTGPYARLSFTHRAETAVRVALRYRNGSDLAGIANGRMRQWTALR